MLSQCQKQKRCSVEAKLRESLTRRDPLRFEHKAGQISQVGVENGKASRTNRGGRVNRANRGEKVGRADKGRRVNKTVGCGRVGRASKIGRVRRIRGKRNRSIIINRTRAEEARTIRTEVVRVIETISKER